MYREEFLLAYVYISYHRFLILQIFAEVFCVVELFALEFTGITLDSARKINQAEQKS